MSIDIPSIEAQVKLLDLKSGSTLIVQVDPEKYDTVNGSELQELLSDLARRYEDLLVLIVPVGVDLKALDANAMRQMGWTRSH